jgi:hypothetical protein
MKGTVRVSPHEAEKNFQTNPGAELTLGEVDFRF